MDVLVYTPSLTSGALKYGLKSLHVAAVISSMWAAVRKSVSLTLLPPSSTRTFSTVWNVRKDSRVPYLQASKELGPSMCPHFRTWRCVLSFQRVHTLKMLSLIYPFHAYTFSVAVTTFVGYWNNCTTIKITLPFLQWCMHRLEVGPEDVSLLESFSKWYILSQIEQSTEIKHQWHNQPLISRWTMLHESVEMVHPLQYLLHIIESLVQWQRITFSLVVQ